MDNEEKILAILTAMQSEMGAMRSEMGTMRSEIGQINGRLDRLEATQAQHGERLEEMQETLTRVAVTQEGVVLPRIQMLFDGHSELKRELDTLATKEQVEELAADVDVIKTVVTRHSGDINKLKKAQ
jgi:chromosome segregation ATPase